MVRPHILYSSEPVAAIGAYRFSDLWTLDESIAFYKGAIAIDQELELGGLVCHETHRNRSCWNLDVTTKIIREVPQ